MTIRLLVSMQAAPGKRAVLLEAFLSLCKSTRDEEGCQQYEFFQSTERPDYFTLLEKWADQDALDAHINLLRSKAEYSTLSELRLGSPDVERYDT